MRNLTELLVKRYETLERAEKDNGFRKEVLYRCKEDTLYWFDNFAFTFNPKRKDLSELAFIPYDGKQIEYIRLLDEIIKNPMDVFVDKPRDVGATSLTMNVFLKHWLFDEWFNAKIGSKKEDYVDQAGDPDTLFYKLDYTMSRLPDWMLPQGWDKDKHRNHMRLIRPDNSNTIIGESANPNFARGGRQTIVLFDEIGFWPFARSAWESAGDVTDARIGMTTPPDTGKSSFAYSLLSQQSGKIHVFAFEFSDIPSKTAEWFAQQKERRSREELEREILKSYSGTSEGKVYFTDWKLYVKETMAEYDPLLPLFIGWDFGLDTVAMIWFQKEWKSNRVKIIDSYSNSDKAIDFYVPFVTGQVTSGLFEYSDKDLEKIRLHQGWKRDITHYGDPSVMARNLVDKQSPFSALKEKGIYVMSKPWGGRKHRDIREKAKLLLRRLEVNAQRCADFIECMLGARYPKVQETSEGTSEHDKPVHNWTSHFRSAFEYFADNEPTTGREEKLEDTLLHKKKPVGYYKPMGGYH